MPSPFLQVPGLTLRFMRPCTAGHHQTQHPGGGEERKAGRRVRALADKPDAEFKPKTQMVGRGLLSSGLHMQGIHTSLTESANVIKTTEAEQKAQG